MAIKEGTRAAWDTALSAYPHAADGYNRYFGVATDGATVLLGTKIERYDIPRRTSGHVGYGSGIHMCVGQLVARLEGEVMMAALARKVKSIEIAGEVKRRYNNTLRGLESLPITIEAA